MARKSKIFLVASVILALGGGALLFANARIEQAAERSHWTGELALGEAPTVIIVLGMGATPAVAIDDRAELAAEVWKKSLARLIVASGGRGPDDEEAESAELEHHLVTRGVPQSAILQESQSTSTFQNLSYSQALLREHGLAGADVAVVTHDFHSARAGEIARSLGLRARVISTRGTRLDTRTFLNARELLAFWKWRILGW